MIEEMKILGAEMQALGEGLKSAKKQADSGL